MLRRENDVSCISICTMPRWLLRLECLYALGKLATPGPHRRPHGSWYTLPCSAMYALAFSHCSCVQSLCPNVKQRKASGRGLDPVSVACTKPSPNAIASPSEYLSSWGGEEMGVGKGIEHTGLPSNAWVDPVAGI